MENVLAYNRLEKQEGGLTFKSETAANEEGNYVQIYIGNTTGKEYKFPANLFD